MDELEGVIAALLYVGIGVGVFMLSVDVSKRSGGQHDA